jgi:hypothetical protein
MRMIMTKPLGHIKPVNKWRDLIYDHANFQIAYKRSLRQPLTASNIVPTAASVSRADRQPSV